MRTVLVHQSINLGIDLHQVEPHNPFETRCACCPGRISMTLSREAKHFRPDLCARIRPPSLVKVFSPRACHSRRPSQTAGSVFLRVAARLAPSRLDRHGIASALCFVMTRARCTGWLAEGRVLGWAGLSRFVDRTASLSLSPPHCPGSLANHRH